MPYYLPEEKPKEEKPKEIIKYVEVKERFGGKFDWYDIALIIFICAMVSFAIFFTIYKPRIVANLTCGRSLFDTSDTPCNAVVETTGFWNQIALGFLNFFSQIADWILGSFIIIPLLVFILRYLFRKAGWSVGVLKI